VVKAFLSLGLVAAAATIGALIGIGHRLGSVALPFAATAAALLDRTTTSSDAQLVAIGLVLHVGLTFVWTAVFVWLARGRGWKPAVAAIVVAAGVHGLTWFVAWKTGRGVASVLPLGDRIVLAIVFAAALAVGIRFAFSPRREDTAFG
jgi:hypothetical protein